MGGCWEKTLIELLILGPDTQENNMAVPRGMKLTQILQISWMSCLTANGDWKIRAYKPTRPYKLDPTSTSTEYGFTVQTEGFDISFRGPTWP